MKRLLLLLFAAASGCLGQISFVANAIGTNSSRVNLLVPQMLAKLTDADPSATITSIAIRPAGSSALIPATILSSQNPFFSIAGGTFVVPAGVPYGSAQLIWRVATGQYRSLSVTVQQSNFELAGGVPDTLAAPVQPDQIETLTGSGLGYGNTVTATLGGVPATVIYAGRGAPAGYDQIQIRIPAGVSGCFVPLAITVGQSTITGSTVSISPDGSPCQNSFHLAASDLALLDHGGSIAIGEVSLSSNLQVPVAAAASRLESASVTFGQWAAASFSGFVTAPANGCSAVSPLLAAAFRSGDFSGPVSSPPDPGPSLFIQNGSAQVSLSKSSPGYYVATLPLAQDGSLTTLPASVFPPGKWTLSLPGSADIAASSFTFTLASPLLLNGGSPLSLRRDQDQTISWNGSNFDSASNLTLILNGVGAYVTCSASASAGSLTIPATMLAGFAPASIGSISASVQPAAVSMPSTLLKTTKGATLLLFVNYATRDNRPVDFQ